MKKYILLFLSLSSSLAFSEVSVDHIKRANPYFQTLNIVKEKNCYYLKLVESGTLDRNGNNVTHDSISIFKYQREIVIPIKLELIKKSGFDGSIQLLGFGDANIKTGRFRNVNNLKFKDIFTTFSGSSTNIGLSLIGGGYTKLVANNGAMIKESNGSIAFVGPAGLPIGLNTGFTFIDFDMTISSPLKAVPVKYKVVEYYDGHPTSLKIDETRAESFDEVSEIDLKDTSAY